MIELHTFRMGPKRALVVLMVCRGALNLIQASALRDLFAELVAQRPAEFIIDLSKVTCLDEAVAEEVLRLKDQALESECRLMVFEGERPHVRRMLSRSQWLRSDHVRPDARVVS